MSAPLRFALLRHRGPLFVLVPLAALVFLGASGVPAGAQHSETAPSAPDPGSLSYDVPVPEWIAGAAIELKREFVAGVAAEAVSLAETRASDHVTALVEAADELAAVAQRVDATMSSIGAIDSSFGIPGVTRLLTAEGAVRDTLFGFVVWHESAAGESRGIVDGLKTGVAQLMGLGADAQRYATQLSTNADETRAALEGGEYTSLAGEPAALVEAWDGLEAVAYETDQNAKALEELVWTIQESGGSRIETEYEQVLLSVSEARRLAAGMRSAVASLRVSSGMSEGLAGALVGIAEAVELMEAAEPDERGMLHFPWTVLEADVNVATSLEQAFVEEGYPEATSSLLRNLLGKLVAADRILAERAVEHVSTEVARSSDRLEDHYKRVVGYDSAASGREKEEALRRVDEQLRKNADLQAARASARACRSSFAAGMSREAGGAGSEGAALKEYRNAWIHALNAGASAIKSLGTVSSE